MTTRHCPKCTGQALKEKTLSDRQTKIDVCPSCRGGWFDATELSRVLSVAVEKMHALSNAVASKRQCPKCDVALSQINYPETEIEVDVCGRCSGIWLDRGEFRDINKARGKYQDKEKMSDKEIEMLPKPTTLKEAVINFVDRILVRMDV